MPLETFIVMRSYKYKLYKSNRNKILISKIELAAKLHNHIIALHTRYYRLFGKHLNYFKLCKHIAKIKKVPKFSYWNDLNAQAIEMLVYKIESNYCTFYTNLEKKKDTGNKDKVSPPSFRSVNCGGSFTLRQSGYKYLGYNKLKIFNKVYKFHKDRDVQGKIKLLNVTRDSVGDLFVSFVCEVEQRVNRETVDEVLNKTENCSNIVGYDFGLNSDRFLVASNGEDVSTPLFFKESEAKLIELDKSLSSKVKGSNNYKKAKIKRAKLQRHIANQRSNFQWNLAKEQVLKADVHCFETLDLNEMKERRGGFRFGKKVSDIAMADFLAKLTQQAEKYGKYVVKVPRYFPSTQLCGKCGFRNTELKGQLQIRHWVCPNCGAEHDRDFNAAINIRNKGIEMFKEGKFEKKRKPRRSCSFKRKAGKAKIEEVRAE